MINLSTQPDVCVFIGRFEPLHKGHVSVIEEGLNRGRFMVVLVGSAHEPRSFRNPFTSTERIEMIQAAFDHDPRLVVLPLEDSDEGVDEWVGRVYQTVDGAWDQIVLNQQKTILPEHPQISLIGYAKDASSYYLELFPKWGSINVPQKHVLSATDIREDLFGSLGMIQETLEHMDHADASQRTNDAYLNAYTPMAHAQAQLCLAQETLGGESARLTPSVISFLQEFIDTDAYKDVAAEYAYVARTQYEWKDAPYPPIFVTADACVRWQNKILLIRRKTYPGKGLWALPGGFVEANERIFNACLRELDEETKFEVGGGVDQYFKATKVFDAPYRSSRGRTVTHAFGFDLPSELAPVFKMNGQTNDEETLDIAFVPKENITRDVMFEDHYSIIAKITRRMDGWDIKTNHS